MASARLLLFLEVPDAPRIGKQLTDGNISVTYDNLDNEDDDYSEMVTRNIFTWLRDEDGFLVTQIVVSQKNCAIYVILENWGSVLRQRIRGALTLTLA